MSTTTLPPEKAWTSDRHRRSVIWVVSLCVVAIVFDGYDLVVYGTILPTLIADPSQLGPVSPEQAGALGSYALVGVLIGALAAGAIGDRIGRRRMMVINIVWFSVGMGLTALADSVTTFGLLRFAAGVGMGALVATVGAVVAEFAPAARKNLYNAIVYSGVPTGGVLASLLAIALRDAIGWRGMMVIGALPLIILLPLALAKLPESPRWLAAQGRLEEARLVSERTGVPLPTATESAADAEAGDRRGFGGLLSRRYLLGTALLGLMSFAGLLLTYGLNTWLPQIMQTAGFNAKNSLLFLLVLNGGAVVGGLIASWLADRTGAKRVVTTTFLLAALALVLLTAGLPLGLLFLLVALAGVGTIGTQVLIYGLVSNYYATNVRAAGVAWCAGFGRLGGILGPAIGGMLIGAGLTSATTFWIFAGVAIAGAAVTLLVPRTRAAHTATAAPPAAALPLVGDRN
ncbi:MFS transporter [Naumannella huperziae]